MFLPRESEPGSFCWLRSDNSLVSAFQFTVFGTAPYDTTETIPYPKAGFSNPTVALLCYSIAAKTTATLSPIPAGRGAEEHYLTEVVFDEADPTHVLVRWVPRSQQEYVLMRCAVDGTTGCTEVTAYGSATGWVPSGAVKSFAGSDEAFMIRDDPGLHAHVLAVNTTGTTTGTGTAWGVPSMHGSSRFITAGQWHVTQIDHIHNGRLFYVSPPRSPGSERCGLG